MVISIDYLLAYDPAVSPCIFKSKQIIGFTNFVFRELQPARRKSLHNKPMYQWGSEEIVTGNKASFCAELTTVV